MRTQEHDDEATTDEMKDMDENTLQSTFQHSVGVAVASGVTQTKPQDTAPPAAVFEPSPAVPVTSPTTRAAAEINPSPPTSMSMTPEQVLAYRLMVMTMIAQAQSDFLNKIPENKTVRVFDADPNKPLGYAKYNEQVKRRLSNIQFVGEGTMRFVNGKTNKRRRIEGKFVKVNVS